MHIGVDKDSGLIHLVETSSANLHDITRAAQLLHGEEEVVYGDAGYQEIEKRAEIAHKNITFRVAMRPGKQRALPNTPDERLLDLVETVVSVQGVARAAAGPHRSWFIAERSRRSALCC